VITKVKEKPIIFKPEMVRAILDGRKTQTRRVVDDKFLKWNYDRREICNHTWPAKLVGASCFDCHQELLSKCRFGKPGDLIWVKETHYRRGKWVKNGFTKTGKQKWRFAAIGKEVRYFDNPPEKILPNSKRETIGWFKRSSLFMPRWASRLTLEITDIRVERLQDISEEDALAEGIDNLICPQCYGSDRISHGATIKTRCGSQYCGLDYLSAIEGFRELWESINGIGSWDLNPWLFVISFKPVEETR